MNCHSYRRSVWASQKGFAIMDVWRFLFKVSCDIWCWKKHFLIRSSGLQFSCSMFRISNLNAFFVLFTDGSRCSLSYPIFFIKCAKKRLLLHDVKNVFNQAYIFDIISFVCIPHFCIFFVSQKFYSQNCELLFTCTEICVALHLNCWVKKGTLQQPELILLRYSRNWSTEHKTNEYHIRNMFVHRLLNNIFPLDDEHSFFCYSSVYK